MTGNENETNEAGRQYLPANPEEWRDRIAALVKALRNPEVTPCRGHLFIREKGEGLQASIGGITADMAILGGLPTDWLEIRLEDTGLDGRTGTMWDLEPVERDDPGEFGDRFVDASNEVAPEAWIYHGLSIEEGRHHTDVFDLSPTFRSMCHKVYGITMGSVPTMQLNDSAVQEGINPLHLFADILIHMTERPETGFWHAEINEWGRQWREGAERLRQR